MSRHGDVTIKWADGDHTFRLAIGQLRELQEKCNAGPLELYRRMFSGAWRLDDVRETIRLGLIGAGMAPPDALKLVERYVDERPLLESMMVAKSVLGVILLPIEDEPLLGEVEAASQSPTNGSSSRPSTGQASRSA